MTYSRHLIGNYIVITSPLPPTPQITIIRGGVGQIPHERCGVLRNVIMIKHEVGRRNSKSLVETTVFFNRHKGGPRSLLQLEGVAYKQSCRGGRVQAV